MNKKTIISLVLSVLISQVLYIDLFAKKTLNFNENDVNFSVIDEVNEVLKQNTYMLVVPWYVEEIKQDVPNKIIQGYYKPLPDGKSEIVINENLKKEAIGQVMFHEFGHYIFNNILTDQQQYLYNLVYELEPSCITEYSCTNAKENFAEWVVYKYTNFKMPLVNDFVEISRNSVLHKKYFKTVGINF